MDKRSVDTKILTNSILGKNNIPSKNTLGIIGISPFSSFFTSENISKIVAWVDQHCSSYKIFIPDLPTVYSLQSLGYEEDKAIKKARKQCRYLQNKCKKALKHVNRHKDIDTILVYEILQKNPIFQKRLDTIISLYSSSEEFRQACDSFSLDFLLKNNIPPSKYSIRYSSMYLIYELPIFIYANHIFEVEKSFFMYPKCPAFIKDILTEKLIVGISTKQDFLEYKIWN